MNTHSRGEANTKLIAAIAVIALLGVTVWLMTRSPVNEELVKRSQRFYVDLGNGSVFVPNSDTISPIPAPSNASAEAVMVHVFGCGSCAQPHVGHVEKYSPKGKDLLKTPAGASASPAIRQAYADDMAAETLVAAWTTGATGDLDWMPSNADEAVELLATPATTCGSAQIVRCTPNDVSPEAITAGQ